MKGAEDRDVATDLAKYCHCDLNTAFFSLSIPTESLTSDFFFVCLLTSY